MIKDSDYISCETCHAAIKDLLVALKRERDICISCYNGVIALCGHILKIKNAKKKEANDK